MNFPPKLWRRRIVGWLTSLATLCILAGTAGRCHAAATVVAWGDPMVTTLPSGLQNVVAVAAGASHALALRSDGTVVGWGFNATGQASVPTNLVNVTAVDAGAIFSLALQSNGTVVVWGSISAPPASLTNAIAVAAGANHALALTSGGTLVAWGDDTYGQTDIPAGLSNVLSIAAGKGYSVALRVDGTLVAWGDDSYGKATVPAGATNILAIAAGDDHCLALRRDGRVLAWGRNDAGQTSVPASLTNAVAISAGALHSLAIKADGTLAAWGDNSSGQSTVSASDVGYVAISAGGYFNLALRGDGSPFILQQPLSQTVLISKTAIFQVVATSSQPLTYQWMRSGTNLLNMTNASLVFTNVQLKDAGPYTVTVGNILGSLTSAVAWLTPVGGVPTVFTPPQDQTAICGDGARFSAFVGGTVPLSYQWSFQGNAIPGATLTNLTLTNVTPAQAGQYTLTVTNDFGSVSTSANLTVTVSPPTITSALTASGAQGVPFSYQIRALHTPSSFGAMFLPNGLIVNPTTGLISGIPTDTGSYAALITAANACSSDSEVLTITINSAAPVITSVGSVAGVEGQPFNYVIRATGNPTGFGVQGLPVGLSVNPNTGAISGLPTYAGTFKATMWASNQWGVGYAPLTFAFANATIDNLNIGTVTYTYSSPYLLDFQFSLYTLTDTNDPNSGTGVVIDPRLLSAVCLEDDVATSASETGSMIVQGNSKLMKVYVVLDYTASIASMLNGDANSNGISDAVDFMVAGAQDFVNQQSADTQIGVYEFHRDDFSPSNVVALTTDKLALNSAIGGIWTNYVKGFSSGSRCWDAADAAIKALGQTNRDEQHYLVLISDGRDESSTATLDTVITDATNNNVKVFCVGFGDELNATTLQALANATSGRYYTAQSTTDLAAQFAQVAKDTKGQYILRWATLKRSSTAFMPSFQINYQGLTAVSPTNPVFVGSVTTNFDTNTPPNIIDITTNYVTNVIIGPYVPTKYAGPVTNGALRLVANSDIQPSGVDMRASYLPRDVRQLRLHYRANWPCTVTMDSTNLGEMLNGWSMTQTSDGTNGFWLLLSSPDTNNTLTSLPFAGFGRMLTFSFRDIVGTNNAFAFFQIDNSIYSNIFAGGQTFYLETTNAYIENDPVLPYGTPVPWLKMYGYTGNYTNAEVADKDNDGALNWQEYWANTVPTNAASKFVVRSVTRRPDGRFVVTFSTSANRLYRVQASTDLVNWSVVQEGIPGTGTPNLNQDVTVVDTRLLPGVTAIYYRVQVY